MSAKATDYLSQYFTYGEAVGSSTAARRGIDNTPDAETLATIKQTAQSMDAVRQYFGHPIYVSSWFRCMRLNLAIGSSRRSQHITGEAVDFICPKHGSATEVFDSLRRSRIPYDQLILEYPNNPNGGWVHISFADAPRGQTLRIDDHGTHTVPKEEKHG